MSTSLVFKRYISLVKPTPTTIVPTQAELTAVKDTSVEPLFNGSDNVNTHFQVLGTPPSMASLTLPPSVPLYVRKGCLVSLYGSSSLNSTSMSHQWLQPWKKLAKYGSFSPALYHKLISATNFDALVSSNFKSSVIPSWLGISKTPFRTLCLLNLDGRNDWFVFGKDAVMAFEGNTSLRIQDAPLFLRRKNKPAFSSKYQVISGRGNVLLSGSGSVYTIQLNDSHEEIIIKAEHLLGLDGNNQLDIIQAVTEHSLTPPLEKKSVKDEKKDEENVSGEFDFKEFVAITTNLIVKSWNFLKHRYTAFINGPTKYLKIKGPRTLLVQSSHNVYLPATPFSRPHISQSPPLLGSLPIETASPAKNYLSYATVSKNGDVDFRSTPNFQETLENNAKLNKE